MTILWDIESIILNIILSIIISKILHFGNVRFRSLAKKAWILISFWIFRNAAWVDVPVFNGSFLLSLNLKCITAIAAKYAVIKSRRSRNPERKMMPKTIWNMLFYFVINVHHQKANKRTTESGRESRQTAAEFSKLPKCNLSKFI